MKTHRYHVILDATYNAEDILDPTEIAETIKESQDDYFWCGSDDRIEVTVEVVGVALREED